jgi:transcriptional regulator with XRE-family HTH domain
MPISQAEFARRRNVSRARVSQWISGGKVYGAAIVNGQIDEALACQQLNVKLDIDQRLSGNGLRTTLMLDPPPSQGGQTASPLTVESQIAQERLESLQRANRKAALEEIVELGQLVDAAAARQQVGREVSQLLVRFEGSLGGLANDLAAQFKLPQRDVLHYLKGKWREIRAAAAIEARERAEPMPPTVGFDLGDA